jgi:hypothetical protein
VSEATDCVQQTMAKREEESSFLQQQKTKIFSNKTTMLAKSDPETKLITE